MPTLNVTRLKHIKNSPFDGKSQVSAEDQQEQEQEQSQEEAKEDS